MVTGGVSGGSQPEANYRLRSATKSAVSVSRLTCASAASALTRSQHRFHCSTKAVHDAGLYEFFARQPWISHAARLHGLMHTSFDAGVELCCTRAM